MSLTLTVDGERWRSHLRSVAETDSTSGELYWTVKLATPTVGAVGTLASVSVGSASVSVSATSGSSSTFTGFSSTR